MFSKDDLAEFSIDTLANFQNKIKLSFHLARPCAICHQALNPANKYSIYSIPTSLTPHLSCLLPQESISMPGLRVRRAEQGWESTTPGSSLHSRMMSVVLRWRVTGAASSRTGW